MNAERLLAHFERISEAPDAIARLRRFILDLAVRGKLVEQDPEDEPAEELLRLISTEKARLVQAGTIKRLKPLPPITDENELEELRKGWSFSRLGSLIDLLSGQHLQPSEYSENPADGLPYITGPSDFSPGGLCITRYALVRKAVACKGQLLLTVKGSGVGKTAICDHQEVAISRQLMALTAIGWYDRYLALITHRLAVKLQSEARSLIPGISREDVQNFVLPLPPLAEQHRIVAKVDELMALCDQLEVARQQAEQGRERLMAATLQRLNQPAEDPASFRQDASFALQVLPSLTTTPAQIKQLRQTILNLAVRGKLVEQDPEDEPADDLLATISFERVDSVQSRKTKSSRPVAPYDGDGEYELPRGWTWSQLGSITAVEDGAMCDGPFGSKLKTEHYISEPGFAVVRLGNIGIGEFLWGKEGHVTSEHFESLPGNHIRPGDLLIAGLADPLVRCCEAPANLGPAVNKADCFRLRLHRLINRFFVCQFLNSPVAKSFAAEENHGMTRERINLANAKSIPIPLPPLAEQHRIVAKVDTLLALCDQLEQQLSQADQQRRRMLEAVLAEALGGRLPTEQEESHAVIA